MNELGSAATPIFSRRTTTILTAIGVVTLTFGILLGIFSREMFEAPSIQADSFSYSAIGHHAFAELLKRRGITVLKSRAHSERKLNKSGLLIVAEPRIDDGIGNAQAVLRALLARDVPTLLVLRKYSAATPSTRHRRWIDAAPWNPPSSTAQLLKSLSENAELTRPERAALGAWRTGTFDIEPELRDPQLLKVGAEPLVYCAAGILIGGLPTAKRRSPLLVLTDPDVISNHGLGKGHNAELALALVESLRGPDGNVVFDEVLHGHGLTPSVWRELLAFPLVLVTLAVLLGLGVLLWATMGRFGGIDAAPPAIAAGKEALVQNISELLLVAGQSGYAARRYLRGTRRDVCEALHVDPTLSDELLEQRLEAVSRLRHADTSYARLRDELAHLNPKGRQRQTALRVAQATYEWKQELLRATR